MSGRPRDRAWTWIRLIVSAALLAAVLTQIDLAQITGVVAGARIDLILLTVLISIAGRFFAAYRWYLLVHGMNRNVRFMSLVRLTFMSTFLGYMFAGSIAVEFTRIYGLTRATSDLAASFSSVFVERAFGFAALTVLALVGLAIAPPGIPPELGQLAWLGFALGIAGVVSVMHPAPRRAVDRLLSARWLTPVRTRLVKFYARLDQLKGRPGLLVLSAVAAVLNTAFRIVPALLCAWALGVDVTFVHLLIFVPIIVFASQIPISAGGLGVREVGFVALLGLIGVPATEAFVLSLLLSAIGIAVALPGAWFYARSGFSVPGADPATVDPPQETEGSGARSLR